MLASFKHTSPETRMSQSVTNADGLELNYTLQIIAKSNGLCTRCQTKEDVEHVLFRCNKYHEFKQKWQEMEEEN